MAKPQQNPSGAHFLTDRALLYMSYTHGAMGTAQHSMDARRASAHTALNPITGCSTRHQIGHVRYLVQILFVDLGGSFGSFKGLKVGNRGVRPFLKKV